MASAEVVASGTVGPDAITDGSSLGTSEIISETTARGRRRDRQPAAFDRRQVLAHAVHLADRRAAAQQRAIDRLLVLEGDAGGGQRQQSRAAARKKAEHEVVRREARRPGEDAPRRIAPGRIGHRMSRLDRPRYAGTAPRARSG